MPIRRTLKAALVLRFVLISVLPILLIGFATVSRDSNLALIEHCAGLLEGAGAEVQIIRDAAQPKANLFATLGPRDPDLGTPRPPGDERQPVPVGSEAWHEVHSRGRGDHLGLGADADELGSSDQRVRLLYVVESRQG